MFIETKPYKISKYCYRFKPGTIFLTKRANTLEIVLSPTSWGEVSPNNILTLISCCNNVSPHIRTEKQFYICDYSNGIIVV